MEEKTPSASRITEGWVVLDGKKSMKLWCSCYFTCTGICHELIMEMENHMGSFAHIGFPGGLRLGLSWFNGGFLLLQNFSVAISVSPHVCFILVLILISMFLR